MHQRIFLAVVTQTSLAPVASMVAVSPSQSAWSEITSGNSTPRCRARARTRIQPDAKAVTGSGNRRVQISEVADGGANVMVPARSAFFMPLTKRSSPSATPRPS